MIFQAIKVLVIEVDGCFRLYHSCVAEAVNQLWNKNVAPALYNDISAALDLTPTSVRKLEEQIYVLLQAKAWFQLKQTVSNIENFLVLFNPVHKYLLCKCWDSLIAQNYDPVIEYNKSLESFEMHYQPCVTDLYRIVLQLSRFFKEMVDYESDSLPEFRHPLIKNKLLTHQKKLPEKEKTLKDRTLSRKELKETEETRGHLQADDSRYELEDYSIDSEDSERRDHYLDRCHNHLEDIGLLREIKNMGLYDKSGKCDILQGYEKANVDVPAGADQYKKHFSNLIAEEEERKKIYRVQVDHIETQEPELQSQKPIKSKHQQTLSFAIQPKSVSRITSSRDEGRSSDAENNYIQVADMADVDGKDSDTKSELKAMFNETLPASPRELQDNSDSAKPKSFYFYKRWVWIMFPWACMSIEDDGAFSDEMHKCFSSDLRYIKVADEVELTQKAQMIAIHAKLKKKLVLETLKGDCLIDTDLKKLEEALKLNENAQCVMENVADFGFFRGITSIGLRKNTASNLKNLTATTYLPKNSDLSPVANKNVSRLSLDINSKTLPPALMSPIKQLQSSKAQQSFLFLTDVENQDVIDNKGTKRDPQTSHSQSRFKSALYKGGFSSQ